MCGASYLSCVGRAGSGMNKGVVEVEVALMVGAAGGAGGFGSSLFFRSTIGFGIWVGNTVEEWIQSIHGYFA